jgi:probable rRNA maturation factor
MQIHLGDRQKRLEVSRRALRRIVLAVFAARDDRPAETYDELEVMLVDDATIRRLNATYRSLDRATDVLAFDLRGGPETEPKLGEVVISTDRALHQAESCGVTIGEELARLAIHGLLHLQGYDHTRTTERQVMRTEEARLLAAVAGEVGGLVRRVKEAADNGGRGAARSHRSHGTRS